jgi:antitoxin component YwqK of YwqJK toxin-antitoxin module
MKKFSLFAIITLLMISCGREIKQRELVVRNGTAYAINEEKPYSGKVTSSGGVYSGPSESTYKDGKLHGPYISWYKSGQKKKEGMFFNADPYFALKKDGIWTEWYENGQMKLQWTYKDGVKHGPSKWWDKNGKMGYNTMYENGIALK